MLAFHALWIAADMESQHLEFLHQYDAQYLVLAEACLTLTGGSRILHIIRCLYTRQLFWIAANMDVI